VTIEVGDSNPGPGNYSVTSRGSTVGYKMGIKLNSKIIEAPGPGAYNAEILSARERTVSYKIGTSQRTQIINSKSVS
jgi:hypothetical protein